MKCCTTVSVFPALSWNCFQNGFNGENSPDDKRKVWESYIDTLSDIFDGARTQPRRTQPRTSTTQTPTTTLRTTIIETTTEDMSDLIIDQSGEGDNDVFDDSTAWDDGSGAGDDEDSEYEDSDSWW